MQTKKFEFWTKNNYGSSKNFKSQAFGDCSLSFEDEQQSKIYYHYALAVAGILLGIWNVIAKNMLNSGVSPFTFSFIRHGGSWILYRCWHYLQEKPPNHVKDIQGHAGTFML